MFEIANLINERLIGIKPGSDIDLGSPLSPNDLLAMAVQVIKVPSGLSFFSFFYIDGKILM